jgi:ABC-type branched-subunit amino acid transport system ATPase component
VKRLNPAGSGNSGTYMKTLAPFSLNYYRRNASSSAGIFALREMVALGRALGIGTRCLLLDEPFEGIAPVLSERLSEVLAPLKGGDLTLLMSQSDMNHSRGLIDVEFTIERGANEVN